eukprot:scaffold13876_cov84-Amphora_coffeaeformis.AAC.3
MPSAASGCNYYLFIACAWMTNKERRLFQLFPHVLKVDVVKGTNQEDHPLLTASVRTSQGKYIFICRILLSHERIISFRWFSLMHCPQWQEGST